MDILKIPPKPAEAMYNIEKLTKEELVALKCVLSFALITPYNYPQCTNLSHEQVNIARTLIDKVNQIL